MYRFYMASLLVAIFLASFVGIRSCNSQPAQSLDNYFTRIQPIFDKRCVACHSCYNAPCQLNLQSYSGLVRGANKLNVYEGSRTNSVAPTRLDIDGHSVADWRAKGFFDVLGEQRSCPHAADADVRSQGAASGRAAGKAG